MPPRGTDFVDDFLFVTGEGYCNHFSTAMVVLLRAEGIPARWVKGFSAGSPDPEVPGRYVVTQGDAHSWVEVYFPAQAGCRSRLRRASHCRKAMARTPQQSPGRSPARSRHNLAAGSVVRAPGCWRARVLLPRSHGSRQLFGSGAAGRCRGLAHAAASPALRLRLLLAWPRSSFPDRERLLSAAAPVWAALAYGPGRG